MSPFSADSKHPRVGLWVVAGLFWCAAGLAQVVTTFTITDWYSMPVGIVAGSDGAMWFSDAGEKGLGRVDAGGVVTPFALPLYTGSAGIAQGSDGNIWFIEANGVDRIGRMTPGGTLTEFPINGAVPLVWTDRLAAGPDGSLWFTEHDANRIGRITTAGEITHFPVSTATAGLQSIAAGPDGNVWFSESDARNIGRITPSGAITEFALPFHPTGLVAGPDGNLWFGSTTYRVGRITPSGEITEYATPGASANVVASGDSLWFLAANSHVWRMTTDGALTEFSPHFDPPLNAMGMGVGPDGAIWLTGGDGWDYFGAIHRFALDTTACVADSRTLCLNQGRFRVAADWKAVDGSTGHGRAVNLTANSGYFWFFDAANVEMVVKVLDGCASNHHQWVFAAGLTNVEVTTTVTDTFSGLAKTYTNPQGTPFAPIQDTAAFATCP